MAEDGNPVVAEAQERKRLSGDVAASPTTEPEELSGRLDGAPIEPRLPDAVLDAAEEKPSDIPAETRMDALDWLLSDTPLNADGSVKDGIEWLDLDVSMPMEPPRWITWGIRPIDGQELADARRRGRGNRQQARLQQKMGQDQDSRESEFWIITVATVHPDLVRASQKKHGAADPTVILKDMFRYKPGLITQLVGEVMLISGFDDDQMRAAEVKAAGN